MSEFLDESTIRRSTLAGIIGRSNGKRAMMDVAFYRKAFRPAVFNKVNWKLIFKSLKRPFRLRWPWRQLQNGQKGPRRVENGGGIPICAPAGHSSWCVRVDCGCRCGWCVRVRQMSFDQSADVTAYMTSYLPTWFLWILSRGPLGLIWAHVR